MKYLLAPLAFAAIFVPLTLFAESATPPLTISPLVLFAGNWSFDPIEFIRTEEYPLGIPNDVGCAWDPDDNTKGTGNGYLDPGQSASVSTCAVLRWNNVNHTLALSVSGEKGPSGAQQFSAAITIEFFGAVTHDIIRITDDTPIPYTAPVKSYGTVQRERLCVRATYPGNLDALAQFGPIGNFGGTGVMTRITYTATNLSPRRETFSAQAEIVGFRATDRIVNDDLCDGDFLNVRQSVVLHHDGPRIFWNVGTLEIVQ